jgi:hypothetical protein
MKHPLIDKINTDKNQDDIGISNYSIFLLVILVCGYSFLFIVMALNTSSMNNNLNKIIDVINILDLHNVNATSINSIHNKISVISECVLHKYCKRVPS